MTTKPNDQTAANAAAIQEAEAKGHKAGADAAQARMTGIMDLPEAASRRDAAWNIATETEMTVDQAKSLLATLPETPKPEATKPAAGSLFEKAMASGNPDLGAGAGEESKIEEGTSESIMASYRMATGKPAKKK